MDGDGVDLSREISRLTDQLNEAYKRERATRMALLRLHAWLGISVGLMVLMTGTAGMVESDFGTAIRLYLGGLAFLSGVILLAGIGRRGGKYTLEIIGLGLMGLWDFLMVVILTGLILGYEGHWIVLMPWSDGALPPTQPRPYALAVYVVLTTMVWGVHLRAVLRDRKQVRNV